MTAYWALIKKNNIKRLAPIFTNVYLRLNTWKMCMYLCSRRQMKQISTKNINCFIIDYLIKKN